MKPDIILTIDDGLSLRPLMPDDVTQSYVDGLNRREVNAFLQSPNATHQTDASVRDFVQNNLADPAAVLFGIFVDGRHWGNVRLHDIDGTTAWIGIAIFDPQRWGRGLGSRSIRRVAEYGIESLGLDMVWAGIDLTNVKSIAAFERAGFKHTEKYAAGRPAGSSVWVFP
ncbi:MAG: GNAT family N-acetyltransferase [Rhodospirillales bacterium]